MFCRCFIHKHKKKLLYLFFQRTSGLLCFYVLWRNIINTHVIILPCLVQNHWPNLSQSAQCFFQCFATKHLSMPAVSAMIVMISIFDHLHRVSKFQTFPRTWELPPLFPWNGSQVQNDLHPQIRHGHSSPLESFCACRNEYAIIPPPNCKNR